MTLRNCCQSGPCATHLAEDYPFRLAYSIVIAPGGLAFVPNYEGQDLVGAFARAAIEAWENR